MNDQKSKDCQTKFYLASLDHDFLSQSLKTFISKVKVFVLKTGLLFVPTNFAEANTKVKALAKLLKLGNTFLFLLQMVRGPFLTSPLGANIDPQE
jgi:hypothetical protein